MTCYQKQSLGGDSEKSLATINKQIFELKKKIQLSEGQKKAHNEETESESKKNTEKISRLKKDTKILSEQLKKAKTELGGEKQFRLAKYLHELGPVAHKDHEQLKQILDLKVIDLHKQLDIYKFKRRKKKSAMDKLEVEFQKLAAERTRLNVDNKKSQQPSKKTISQLENDIHRIAVQWMEAEHIRKKYTGIRYSLLNDSVKFESALTKVEETIKQQNEEIKKLQEVNASAMQMRDSAMAALVQEEQRCASAAAERESRLAVARRRLSDRRAELDRLERRIFPQARPTLVQQDSMGSVELTTVDEENGSLIGGFSLDEVFHKLMKATGVSDPECVFDRFKAQKTTTERLLYLKNTTEEEKKRLESDQNVMVAELEAYRFAQVKDKEENQEEIENIKNEIQSEKALKCQYELDQKQVCDVLLDIKRSFYDCCLKLEDADDIRVPDWSDDTSNLEDIFRLLQKKYLAASALAEDYPAKEETAETPKGTEEGSKVSARENPPLEKMISEERSALPAAYRELVGTRTKSRGTGTPSGAQGKPTASDEEEEIPSRGFLKRQAQLIVDTKSRRKGFRAPR